MLKNSRHHYVPQRNNTDCLDYGQFTQPGCWLLKASQKVLIFCQLQLLISSKKHQSLAFEAYFWDIQSTLHRHSYCRIAWYRRSVTIKITHVFVFDAVVVSRSTVGEDAACGRVRHLKGFRVEVNGRVYARLAANKTRITLKKCKSGMKYTCVIVVMTSPDKSDGYQRKVRINAS